jgi:hypothetical protein
VALLASLVATAEAIGISMTGVVLAEQHEHPDCSPAGAPPSASPPQVVNDIVENGRNAANCADIDASVTADLILGAYLAHFTHQGDPDRAWVGAIVDTLWRGLAARSF